MRMTDRVVLQESLMMGREEKLNELTKEMNLSKESIKTIKEELGLLDAEEEKLMKVKEDTKQELQFKQSRFQQLKEEGHDEKNGKMQQNFYQFE